MDTWLEIQLSLIGLPHTFVEWCINEFVNWGVDSGADERREKQRRMMTLLRDKNRLNSCDYLDYQQLRVKRMPRKTKLLEQIDVFHTDGGNITSLSFHPLFTTLAVGEEMRDDA